MKTIIIIFLTMFVFGAATTYFPPGVGPAQARQKSRKTKVTIYACPMHPDVVSTSPGACPKCLALRAVKNESKQPGETSVLKEGATDRVPNQSDPTVSVHIPDASVNDQNGNKLKFHTDLVQGKTVAINFIFTTCTNVCPPLTATFRRVQQELGERIGRDVWLISVSVDPATDVPEKLKEYAARFKAGPGWTFVTGDKVEIDSLLVALGVAVVNKNDHTSMILIGNDAAGYWTRAYGLSAPSRLVEIIKATASRKAVATLPENLK
jgi:cytochrome oxidase Cu insertion factor (SCO1/SenC/PrrC family)